MNQKVEELRGQVQENADGVTKADEDVKKVKKGSWKTWRERLRRKIRRKRT